MPRRLSLIQQDILEELCKENGISFISSVNEQDRIKKILKEAYDIIIVGNVGQLNKIILPEAIFIKKLCYKFLTLYIWMRIFF